MLSLLYFAWLRERLGVSAEQVEIPHDVADVAGLVAWQRARSPAHASAFGEGNRIRCAVNQEFAQAAAPIRSGDEGGVLPARDRRLAWPRSGSSTTPSTSRRRSRR